MSAYEFLEAVSSLPIEQKVWFEEIDSTNSEAMRMLLAGEQPPLLCAAGTQTAGRGRFNRRWVSHKCSSITFTLALKPPATAESHLPLYPALAGLAVAQELEDQFGIVSQLKWPNDVLIGRQKVAGILVEAAWQGPRLVGVLIGIGINLLNPSLDAMPGTLRFPATCLQDHTAQLIQPLPLMASIVSRLLAMNEPFSAPTILSLWQQRLAFMGEQVVIKHDDDAVILSGRLDGIDAQGNLLVSNESGEHAIQAGDVHLRLLEGVA